MKKLSAFALIAAACFFMISCGDDEGGNACDNARNSVESAFAAFSANSTEANCNTLFDRLDNALTVCENEFTPAEIAVFNAFQDSVSCEEFGAAFLCSQAVSDVLTASDVFQDTITEATCLAFINAMDHALMQCAGYVSQEQIDAWNDAIASDPCDGL